MLKRFVVVLALFAYAGTAAAQGAGKWVEGKNYFRIEPAQPVSTPGKIEVLDVFSYACPACNGFQPTLDKLKAALPPEAKMAYLSAAFNPQEDWPVFQRAFLAAQSLDVAEKSHDAMYDAVWGKGTLSITDKTSGHLLPKAQQPTIEDVAKFYVAYGVKPEDFLAVAKSFTVEAQIKRSDAEMLSYQVDSTPTLVVNGKYRLTPTSAGGTAQTIELVQYLIAKEKAGK
ncbi:MAG: thiol:disulfide interchange protein DsbA/DsbL [Nevskia sp.]|nr:thiol:disulfide interchange protein DsbA/DsbL [Nevskia sp.]